MDFHSKLKIKTRRISKKMFQKILADLRKAGHFEVQKLDAGYQVILKREGKQDLLVLKAMNGKSDYLVRFEENLLIDLAVNSLD